MKIALIVPANIWFSPYIGIYTSVLDELKVVYDIISWNRDGNDKKVGIQYIGSIKQNGIAKIYSYYKFISFVKNTVLKNKYDKLIVFTSQLAIFMSPFLRKYYSGKYIFDLRDLSIEQNKFLKGATSIVLSNSYANFVSSPGFIKYLPDNYTYNISHNFNIQDVYRVLDETVFPTISNDDSYNVLTIGGIRNYESNAILISNLANKTPFKMLFVGKGPASDLLKNYADENNVLNTEFIGYYPKEKEPEYVRQATFMNIYCPNVASHSSLMSNRFYLALLYKKPMIVTAGSTQAAYVEKYNLGLSITDCLNLDKKIIEWVQNNDYSDFCSRCNHLLNIFLEDYKRFYQLLSEFTKI